MSGTPLIRSVVLRVAALALLLLLALAAVLSIRTLRRLPDGLVYLVEARSASFTLQPRGRTVGSRDLEAHARALLEALIAGPSDDERAAGLSSEVPASTEVLGLVFDDGRLTVDLSAEFARGGGSASMQGRLWQVLWTLSQPASVREVALRVESEPVRWLGGEGVPVAQPWRRPDAAGLPVW